MTYKAYPWPFEPRKELQPGDLFGVTRTYGLHSGIDSNGPDGGNTDCGTELHIMLDGEVIHYSESTQGYGKMLVIECNTPFGKRWIRLCHLQKALVTSGFVQAGQVVALMGTSGNSTACHLHWDVIKKPMRNWRTYARDRATLEEYFEDPLVFMTRLENEMQDSGGEFIERTQFISDAYMALTGERPSEDTMKWRLDQNKNMLELLNDLMLNDDSFKKLWIAPDITALLKDMIQGTIDENEKWQKMGVKENINETLQKLKDVWSKEDSSEIPDKPSETENILIRLYEILRKVLKNV